MNRQFRTAFGRLALVGLLLSTVIAGRAAGPATGFNGPQAGSASAGANNSLTPAEAAAGWKLLFDGQTLSGWKPSGTADWKVTDGAITFSTGRGTVTTEQQFSNFELRLEFWAEKNANSGVFVRSSPKGNGNVFYEINIFDPHQTAPTGSILKVDPPIPPVVVHSVLPDRPDTAEKWNNYEIIADGMHLVVKLNGKTMTDIQEDQLKLVSGTIQLQAGGPDGPGMARFRNIRIRPLK